MKKKKLDLGIRKLSQAIIKGYGEGGPCACGITHTTDMTPEEHNYALLKQGGGCKCNNGLCGWCPNGQPHSYMPKK